MTRLSQPLKHFRINFSFIFIVQKHPFAYAYKPVKFEKVCSTNVMHRQISIVTSLLYSRVMIFSSSKNRRVRRSCFVCNLRSFAKSSSRTHCRLNRIHKIPTIINPNNQSNEPKILSEVTKIQLCTRFQILQKAQISNPHFNYTQQTAPASLHTDLPLSN